MSEVNYCPMCGQVVYKHQAHRYSKKDGVMAHTACLETTATSEIVPTPPPEVPPVPERPASKKEVVRRKRADHLTDLLQKLHGGEDK